MNWNVGSGAQRSFEFSEQNTSLIASSNSSVQERDRQIAQLGIQKLPQSIGTGRGNTFTGDLLLKNVKNLSADSNTSDKIPALHSGLSVSSPQEYAKVSALAFQAIPTFAKGQRLSNVSDQTPLNDLNTHNQTSSRSSLSAEGLNHLRGKLNIDQFSSNTALDSLMKENRERLADIEKRGNRQEAKQEVNLAKTQRAQLQDMLNIMKDHHIERGEPEQIAYRFYYRKAADAEGLLGRMSEPEHTAVSSQEEQPVQTHSDAEKFLSEGGIGRVRRDLKIEQFGSNGTMESLIKGNREHLTSIEKRGDLQAAQREVNTAKTQRAELNGMLQVMKKRNFEPGEAEQNAVKFYKEKESDAMSLLDRLNKPEPPPASRWRFGLFGK